MHLHVLEVISTPTILSRSKQIGISIKDDINILWPLFTHRAYTWTYETPYSPLKFYHITPTNKNIRLLLGRPISMHIETTYSTMRTPVNNPTFHRIKQHHASTQKNPNVKTNIQLIPKILIDLATSYFPNSRGIGVLCLTCCFNNLNRKKKRYLV